MTHMVPTDQMFAAAGFISREWGDHGYRLGCEYSSPFGSAVFLVRHSDGSEFRILVDRWGNATLPAQCGRGTIGCQSDAPIHECVEVAS